MTYMQIHRTDPHRPSVQCASSAINLWRARGYDKDGNFHVEHVFGLQEAHRIATDWATNGYPEAAA